MVKKYVIFILAAFMVSGMSACTSKKSADEGADIEAASGDEAIEAADAGSDDLAVEEGADGAVADLGDTNNDLAADSTPAMSGDQAAAGDLTETPPGDVAAAPQPGDAPLAVDAPPPADTAMDTPPPVVEEPGGAPAPEPMTEAKPVASLQKVKATPYTQGKILVNAVYIARQGDSPESISQKVFGSKDKVKELCKVNSFNCSRTTKVGDKFYYNSPQRPTDDTVVKVFYEDAGIAPQLYVTQAGDNIRKLAKTMLGHDRSWMEIWATNEVDSKGDLEEGVKLRYWPKSDDGAPTQTMAQTETPAAPPVDQAPPPPAGDAPPMDQMAANQAPPPDMGSPDANMPPPPPPSDTLPPPPDQNQMAAGSMEPPPPPPPPPPTDMGSKEPAAVDAGSMEDPNQTMALGVGAVLLLAAAALFISIRKKRQRRQIDFNTTTQTQIE